VKAIRLTPTLLSLSLALMLLSTRFQQNPPQETPESEQAEPFVGPPAPPPPPPGLLPLRELAEIKPSNYPEPPALFHEGTLVVVCRGGVVEGFDAETGEFLWKLGLPGKVFLPPRATSRGILLSTADGTLLEADASTGEISKESVAPIALALAPLISDTIHVLASPEGEVVAIDPATDQPLWRVEIGEAPGALAKGGDLVVVSGSRDTLTAVEVVSGQIRWSLRGRGPFRAPAVFDAKAERLYIGDGAGVFYSLSAKNGKVRYRWELGAAIVHPVLLEGDRLYLVSYANTLTAYRAGNGHEMWRFNIPGRPASQPVRVNQRIAVATMEGFIVEVSPDRGRRRGSPYKAPTSIRANASFYPPYAALTLLPGPILLLETAPELASPASTDEATEDKKGKTKVQKGKRPR
jgi:outer membrane protein assembly factor BamB